MKDRAPARQIETVSFWTHPSPPKRLSRDSSAGASTGPMGSPPVMFFRASHHSSDCLTEAAGPGPESCGSQVR